MSTTVSLSKETCEKQKISMKTRRQKLNERIEKEKKRFKQN
jgi:hypothetical protein